MTKQTNSLVCPDGDLNSEPLAAFGSARGDHGAAAAGFHARQKAVCAGAFDFRGLVSAFHN